METALSCFRKQVFVFSKIALKTCVEPISKGKLHKRIPNYSAFSLKVTNVAKRSIECMNLSKPFNVGYSVTLRSKLMTEPKIRAFHVIFQPRTTTFAPHLNDQKTRYTRTQNTLFFPPNATQQPNQKDQAQTLLSNSIVKRWVFILGHYPPKLPSYFRS